MDAFSIQVVENAKGKLEHHASSQAQAKHFYKKDDGGGSGRSLCKKEGCSSPEEVTPQESPTSFNREQIIVEVNLNNQTLNVSKGSEGKTRERGQTLHRTSDNDKDYDQKQKKMEVSSEEEKDEEEEEDEENDEDDDDDDDDNGEEENDYSIPEVPQAIVERPRRGTRARAVSLCQGLASGTLAQGKKEQESLGQKVKLEEKQHFACKRCPRVFNNRWYLEKHTNVTHNRMQICNKCGKRFLLESELLLHHQTSCEKSIQVYTLPYTHTHTGFFFYLLSICCICSVCLITTNI